MKKYINHLLVVAAIAAMPVLASAYNEYKDIHIGNSFQYIDEDNKLIVTLDCEGDGEVVVTFSLNVLSDDLVF